MRRLINTAFCAGTAVLLASPLAAQGRKSGHVPPGQMPAAGMCRVWVNGVPPGQQAAATDCATAQLQASRTANARVIYGRNVSNGDVDRRRTSRNCTTDALGRVICTTPNGTLTRERTNDGWMIWRDANGNIVRREQVRTRTRGDDNDRFENDHDGDKHDKDWKKGKHGDDNDRFENDHDGDKHDKDWKKGEHGDENGKGEKGKGKKHGQD